MWSSYLGDLRKATKATENRRFEQVRFLEARTSLLFGDKDSMKRFVGVKQLAEELGVKRGTLYLWVHMRQIPHFKIGRLVKFDPKEIDGWLKDKAVHVMT